jgi:ribonuclease-3
MKKLQIKINYSFNDNSLLRQALTHRSAGKNNNERLEFLGDSILGMVISSELYKRFSDVDEGKLSRLRSQLVRGNTLAEIGINLDLSSSLILGSGELKSGGHRRESIQADVVEAIFGAIYLDSDFETVSTVILELYSDLLVKINPSDSLKDSKTELQEYLQKRGKPLPKYELVKTLGKDHNAVFIVKCFLSHEDLQTEQQATSIKRAEQSCAQILLERLRS